VYPDADPAALRLRFNAAGKVQILTTQMTWVIGNIPEFDRIEMFSQTLRTPLSGIEPHEGSSTFDSPIPTTIEEWIKEQNRDAVFRGTLATIPEVANRNGLYLYAPDDEPPRILVPPQTRESLVRFTHEQMFHLGQAKVSERLHKGYYWPSMRGDIRRWLHNCPECEVEKARQNQAHGLFRARPYDAPRTRFAMDFQGQGLASSGENEALAIIDTTTRFVTVIAMKGREASTFVPLFLDNIVFRHGAPRFLHCDEAPEFMSSLVKELLAVTETVLTTTLAHNARSNGVVEVFWRYWNRCMRLLSDEQYAKWPKYVARITFAYNTAPHQSLGSVSPFELYFGTSARLGFSAILDAACNEHLPQPPDEEGDIAQVRLFAAAVKTSTTAFIQLARNHDQYVKTETALTLNANSHPRTFVIGDMVKARFPPTQVELLATGRRSNHVSSWRGPCRVVDRLSATSYAIVQLDTTRRYERMIGNLLPWHATSVRKNKSATFDPIASAPFQPNEFIAIRDEPKSYFFVAKILTVNETSFVVHYYGTKSNELTKAKFFPSWHYESQDHITLAVSQPRGQVKYSGIIQLDSVQHLLVARNLKLTVMSILTSKSRRQLMPIRDELFLYE
jgi:hypothetical protein